MDIFAVTQTHVQHSPVRATITVMPPDEVDEAASSSLGNPFSHDDNGDGAAIHLLAVGPHPDQEEEDDVRGNAMRCDAMHVTSLAFSVFLLSQVN